MKHIRFESHAMKNLRLRESRGNILPLRIDHWVSYTIHNMV